MAVTYPLTLPSSPVPRRTVFRVRRVVAVARSPFTLQQKVQRHQGEAWEVEAEYPPMTRAQAAAWQAILLKLRGRHGTFLMGDVDAKAPRGVATGTPLVDSSGGGNLKGDNELITDGWTPSVTGIMKAADYIQLGTGSSTELYMVVDDANSGAGAGPATLNIEPALRTAPADNASITVNDTVGVFRLAGNTAEWDADAAPLYGIAFSSEEAI